MVQAKDTSQETYRTQQVTLNENAPTEVYFPDTEPNYIVFTNPTSNPMYISTSANVSPTYNEMQIPANGTKMFCRPSGMKNIFIWHADNQSDQVPVVSFVAKFNPSNIPQTSEQVSTQQVTGNVGVTSLPALAPGSNTIGNVGVSTLPSLPAGSNGIGNVGVTSLPSLVAGSANIGHVNVDALPAVDVVGYQSYPVTASVAGTVTVKGSAGKVASIRPVGSITVSLYDNTTQVWDAIAGGTSEHFSIPVQCETSIVLNFSGAGTAYIQYE